MRCGGCHACHDWSLTEDAIFVKAPKIQRLITPQLLQRKRYFKAGSRCFFQAFRLLNIPLSQHRYRMRCPWILPGLPQKRVQKPGFQGRLHHFGSFEHGGSQGRVKRSFWELCDGPIELLVEDPCLLGLHGLPAVAHERTFVWAAAAQSQ